LRKFKLYAWTLERWFAWPVFASSAFLGLYLAGGNAGEMRAWLGILMVTGLVAWGHCMNSVLDYEADLDKGEIGERSASKSYSGGQSVIASGQASREAIIYISMLWALFSLGIAVWFASHGTWIMIPLWGIGIAVPFVYTEGKFSWYHELALGVGVGPLAAMVGAYAVNPSPPIIHCLLASIPFAIVLAFAGLSLDEWPDAKQNLIKGVKSLAFKIYEWSDWTADIKLGTYVKSLSLLQFYVSAWLLFMMVFQVFLITIGVLSPMTGIAFLAIPVAICLLAMLKWNFNKVMLWLVFAMGAYSILLVVGQAVK
jgi:4-hydroxybenzoate polyprenyltransferase